jgi:hypothetical protein
MGHATKQSCGERRESAHCGGHSHYADFGSFGDGLVRAAICVLVSLKLIRCSYQLFDLIAIFIIYSLI